MQKLHALEIDFGKSAADYGSFRSGFPPGFLDRLCRRGVGLPSQRILDLGTGTGLLALDLARRCSSVVGIDPSVSLLTVARDNAWRAHITNVRFLRGRAEQLPLEDRSFDVVCAATAWHWFDASAAAAEAARVLVPGGVLTIAALEWSHIGQNVPALTRSVIRRFVPPRAPYRPSTLHYPSCMDPLIGAGFHEWDVFGYTTKIPYTHEAWRGRVRASQGVGPVMDDNTLQAFDRALAEALEENFPSPVLHVEHRIFAIVAKLVG